MRFGCAEDDDDEDDDGAGSRDPCVDADVEAEAGLVPVDVEGGFCASGWKVTGG